MLQGAASRDTEDEGVLLDAWLPHGLRLMQQPLAVGIQTLQLVVPFDVDAVCDLYIGRGQEDADPYWSRPWPSAVALASELLRRPELVAGQRTVEVGAGLGVATIAAALAGAAEAVATDREPLALMRAQHGASAHQVRAELLDWAAVRTSGRRYDLVLACDVLYEAFSVEPVAALVARLVHLDGGRLLLADPLERTRHHRELFVELLQAAPRRGGGRLVLEEASVIQAVVGARDVPTAVQLLAFRSSLGADTVGVKRLQH
ncbi:hypothetical protein WJX81_007839 [Elliptochloris bilobata]|uniref:Methyltransferase type 12 n=1 Tax=Elliptochloris bilobata TaxID=381761 RepID=A0AAW1RXQ1_9CHLO